MRLPAEELLHHIWQYRLYNFAGLQTVEGASIEVIRTGELNPNAGPDFLNARLKIGGTDWAGNVEIHVRSSDWIKHQHEGNPSYENIILHVVFENDLEESVGAFPTVELKHLISDQVLRKYESLSSSTADLPCRTQFLEVPSIVRNGWLDALIISRLHRKAQWILELMDKVNGDMEQVFQIALFRSFGMSVNAAPFELLAHSTPWRTLAKHQDDLFQLEAVLFGNAGFLSEPEEPYQAKLSKEYEFLKTKYSLHPMGPSVWKFSRMHPKNFPTLRIAQLASLYHEKAAFLSGFRTKNVSDVMKSLLIEPSEYWQSHYRFGKEFATKSNRVGEQMARNIIINVLAPFLFALSEREAKPGLKDEALAVLSALKAEKNAKTREFENVGFKPENALESQALIELKSNYCELKKCLICRIGANILRQEK